MPAKKFSAKGLAILGDAYNMRHPLTGGGMTIALNDCCIISDLMAREQLHDVYNTHQMVHTFHLQRKPMALTVNTLALALYKVFAADKTQARQEMQRGCFDYLNLGGDCAQGPISLLSGLNPRPQVLFYHFFAVAFYACGNILAKTKNIFAGLWLCLTLLCMAASIILPVLFAEGLFSYALTTAFIMFIYAPCKRATEVMMLTCYRVLVVSISLVLKAFYVDLNVSKEDNNKQ